MTVSVLGVRHHGPGSARSLVDELTRLEPDVVLLEGPPEGNELIPFVGHAEMRPPVALLIYAADDPKLATFYPFAAFSPEWQALRYAVERGVEVRFFDLAVGSQLAAEVAAVGTRKSAPEIVGEGGARPPASGDGATSDGTLVELVEPDRHDPLGWLARAAGYDDGERWWDHMVESRRSSEGVFRAILEAMTAVRSEIGDEDPLNPAREAAMRMEIRAAQKAGRARIAVVCGAWHSPALVDLPPAAHDERILRKLPKRLKTAAAWVPWTYDRLAIESGYGAGVGSPGWYEHLWSGDEPLHVTWMGKVARVFREADLDASAAHLIESARLAETLAAMRGRSAPSLTELNEATTSVLAFGSEVSLALVRNRLIVGEVLGEVPAEVPFAPLAEDLNREQRRLRLRPEPGRRTLDLDLRSETDLARSHLLHRLRLLDVPWGEPQRVRGKAGTFHELWSLAWRPEFAVNLVVNSRWGNTIAEAAAARAIEEASGGDSLADLTALVEQTLLADLVTAVEAVVSRIGEVAAVAADVPALMDALPPLARVLRYGNVRGTDAEAVRSVVDGLVARIAVGLRQAAASLDDDAAAGMAQALTAVDGAIALIDDAPHTETWGNALLGLIDQGGVHGLVTGRAVRLLLDGGGIDQDEATRRMRLALSPGSDPLAGAGWVEGFLSDSGVVLLHDTTLWRVLDDWIGELPRDAFDTVLPLLRRTVATFPPPERRALGERAKGERRRSQLPAGRVDPDRAQRVMPILVTILGLDERDGTEPVQG